MQLLSSDFLEGTMIPTQFTCEGDNISPSFEVGGIPEGATCLVFIMDDPDAPAGTFVHWIMWNMPFHTEKFSSQALPDNAVEGTNGVGKVGYVGPCPPSGTHRYFFRLCALSASLDLPDGATIEKLKEAMMGHIVAETELVGLYEKRE